MCSPLQYCKENRSNLICFFHCNSNTKDYCECRLKNRKYLKKYITKNDFILQDHTSNSIEQNAQDMISLIKNCNEETPNTINYIRCELSRKADIACCVKKNSNPACFKSRKMPLNQVINPDSPAFFNNTQSCGLDNFSIPENVSNLPDLYTIESFNSTNTQISLNHEFNNNRFLNNTNIFYHHKQNDTYLESPHFDPFSLISMIFFIILIFIAAFLVYSRYKIKMRKLKKKENVILHNDSQKIKKHNCSNNHNVYFISHDKEDYESIDDNVENIYEDIDLYFNKDENNDDSIEENYENSNL